MDGSVATVATTNVKRWPLECQRAKSRESGVTLPGAREIVLPTHERHPHENVRGNPGAGGHSLSKPPGSPKQAQSRAKRLRIRRFRTSSTSPTERTPQRRVCASDGKDAIMQAAETRRVVIPFPARPWASPSAETPDYPGSVSTAAERIAFHATRTSEILDRDSSGYRAGSSRKQTVH